MVPVIFYQFHMINKIFFWNPLSNTNNFRLMLILFKCFGKLKITLIFDLSKTKRSLFQPPKGTKLSKMTTLNFSIKGQHESHNGTATIVPNYNEGTILALNDLMGTMDNLVTRKIGNVEGFDIYENYYDGGSDDYLYFAIAQ